MKKGFTVLILAVLISGIVFAGTFTGSAGISFGVDLDDQYWGFVNSTSGKYTFSFEYDSTAVSIGDEHQTEIWAELAASASAKSYTSKAGLSDAGEVKTEYTAAISKANIHIGEAWTIGILNAGGAKFYASYFELNSLGDAAYDVITASTAGASKVAPGFTVTYTNEDLGGSYVAGFGAKGLWTDDDSEYTIFAHLTTPEFKFVDDQVLVAASGYGVIKESDKYIGANAKAGFNAEKFGVILAADTAIKNGNFGNEAFVYEIALNAQALDSMVTFDAYATPGALIDGSTRSAYYTGDYAESMALDMKVAGKYTIDIDEENSVDLSAYFKVCDTLIDYRAFFIGATESATIDAFTFKLGETVMIQPETEEMTLELYAYAEYAAEKFTAYAEIDSVVIDLNGDDDVVFPFEVGISSDAVVEGATLALVYANEDFVAENKGAVTASCTIAF